MKARDELMAALRELENSYNERRKVLFAELETATPPPLKLKGFEVAALPAEPGFEVSIHGSSKSLYHNLVPQDCILLRDFMLAAYPLDTPDAGWVSVDERLPDTDRNVLVCFSDPTDKDSKLLLRITTQFFGGATSGATTTLRITKLSSGANSPRRPRMKGMSNERRSEEVDGG